ncbi:MAG: aminotransferase class III-fold pyridoxal phosphate-dependent enzyme [Candidatus Omnitrophica bacterium]|jgi:4-aminobutyrate aminotransferase-like enzyme|nr:aminotransferase class III-fold pyridoxal phosphate-dependent enzyme [Candidatus Omnitrophota bacterium]MDD3987550.1 aminotransferase class III-fold pyridoxal phosphate-dependent enzyme [Candidatus Omnitrophota bacterium]MDD4981515.1 aminotransferase class III-fold pyridoxal phosphate-dependent enzyme [Candidatus Omnitrophota bacterium]MDD5665445.1 aminotransferase class III-fold pyridoxal phosphate-dependent enzyme [Candidatus Omnitrophota bacterium]
MSDKLAVRETKTDKINRQENLLELEAKYCSWGDTVHYADTLNIFKSAKGSFLYDSEGVEYLDLQMWYSAANFGYRNKRLNTALKKQIDTLPQLACQYLHEEKIRLAAKISRRNELAFEEKGRVHFNVGGSSALEDSLKLVRNHSGRSLCFAFMGGYHGRTLAASAITSSFRYRERFGHFGDRALFIPFPYCFRCPYDKKKDFCDFYCLKQFERLFETEYHSVVNKKTNKCEFAAFYVEAVQGTGGYIIPPQNYFSGLKEILDRYGILFVDDEIQMGFFRTGRLWAIEHFNVTPDIIVFGKALTNGLNPISGVWAKESLISPKVFPPGSTHSTFSSNPLGTAVGLEVMKLIEESNFSTEVPRKGRYLVSRFKDLQKKYPQIGDVNGLGLAIRVEMCGKDGYSPDKELTDRIANLGLSGRLTSGGKRRGLILDVGGYYKNVFTIAPSFYITQKEMDLGCDLFEEALIKAIKKA